jgi:hypothetical protein
MRPDFADHDLDAEVVFDRVLGSGDLDRFQEVLVSCHRLRVWRASRVQVPVELSDPGGLAGAVQARVGEWGETYRALAAEHDPAPFDRFAGSVELRGAGPELTVVVSVDQLVLLPSGSQRRLGNGIALQVRRAGPRADCGGVAGRGVRGDLRIVVSRLALRRVLVEGHERRRIGPRAATPLGSGPDGRCRV